MERYDVERRTRQGSRGKGLPPNRKHSVQAPGYRPSGVVTAFHGISLWNGTAGWGAGSYTGGSAASGDEGSAGGAGAGLHGADVYALHVHRLHQGAELLSRSTEAIQVNQR